MTLDGSSSGPDAPSPPPAHFTMTVTNGLAIASMITSIAALVACIPLGIAGALMGHAARRQIRATPGQGGDGMALAGIIIGWIATGLTLLVVLGAAAFLAWGSSSASAG